MNVAVNAKQNITQTVKHFDVLIVGQGYPALMRPTICSGTAPARVLHCWKTRIGSAALG
jgi:hypothetical protein